MRRDLGIAVLVALGGAVIARVPQGGIVALAGFLAAGHVAVEALWPRPRAELDRVERLSLAALLALVAVPASAVLLELAGLRVDLPAWCAANAGLTLALALVAALRDRAHTPPAPTQAASSPQWDSTGLAALVLAVIVLGGAAVWTLPSLGEDESFTQILLLPASGVLHDLPTNASVGERVALELLVTSRENDAAAYALAASVERDPDGTPTTFVPGEPTSIAQERFRLEPGSDRTVILAFEPAEVGLHRLRVELAFEDPERAARAPLRAHLWLNVRG